MIVVAGCTGPAEHPEQGLLLDLGPHDTPFAPSTPYWFPTEPKNGTVTLRLGWDADCAFEEYESILSYSVYDAAGRSRETYVSVVPPGEAIDVDIDLEGRPPFVLAGRSHACSEDFSTVLRGASEPNRMNLSLMNEWVRTEYVEIVLPPGATQASAQWVPSEWDWRLEQTALPDEFEGQPNPSGNWRGTGEIVDPRGTVIRTDTITALGHVADFGPMIKVPGTYTFRVTLEEPWPEASTWVYGLQVMGFTAAACDEIADLRWAICTQ